MNREAKDPTYLKEIAQIMEDHGLTRVSVIENKNKYESQVILEKGGEVVASVTNTPSTFTLEMPAVSDVEKAAQKSIVTRLEVEEITSPMVAVFFSSPSPEADPFVRIGDTVKKGDVLCILEAMKLMNEITAEKDCKIIDICVNNSDVVEFGQLLFKVEAV